jgi:hypothetical protein
MLVVIAVLLISDVIAYSLFTMNDHRHEEWNDHRQEEWIDNQ